MKSFVREINGFYNNGFYSGDTESLYIEKKKWDVLDKANLVGKNSCQSKNEYDSRGVF